MQGTRSFEQLTQVRSFEEGNPPSAIAAYRKILAVQPVHAQTHHRLARLLESEGSFAQADRHYILARDLDGLPMRAPLASNPHIARSRSATIEVLFSSTDPPSSRPRARTGSSTTTSSMTMCIRT